MGQAWVSAVIRAKTGIRLLRTPVWKSWIPAFAGMTARKTRRVWAISVSRFVGLFVVRVSTLQGSHRFIGLFAS
jgi:hypothetical protein